MTLHESPSGAPAPISLTSAEAALLAAYRAMDDEARGDIMRIAGNLVKDFPPAPRLRLVGGPS